MQQQSLTSMSIYFFVSHGKLERFYQWQMIDESVIECEDMAVKVWKSARRRPWVLPIDTEKVGRLASSRPYTPTFHYTAWYLDAGQTGQSYFDCGGCVTLFVLYVLWASCEVQAFCTRPGLAGSPPMTFSCSRKSCAANMSASHIFSSIKRAQRV